MKTNLKNLHAPVSYFRILPLIFLSFILVQCKKNNPVSQEGPVASQKNTKSEKLKELTWQILSLAKNKEFKQLVYDECKAQKFGDYYVRLEDLLKNPNASISISTEKAASIAKLVNQLKELGARNPIIFYPSVETKEDKIKKKDKKGSSRVMKETSADQEVVAVIDDGTGGGGGGGGYSNDEYPGYTFNTNGQLDYVQQITEEFAWEHDVWVIGEEENCSDGNMVAAIEDPILNPQRVNGEAEYGGIIQVTNLGELESWLWGKLEFRYVVTSAFGIIIKDKAFGKVKRKYFRDWKVYDFNDFIANWNIANIGSWMIEGWIEEDGGNSTSTINQTFPAPCTGCASTSVTYAKQNKDQDLGRTMIQFSDAKAQWYGISYSNIKRK